MGRMATGDPEETARLARQVLTLAGLRDRAEDDHPGGFQVSTLDGQVTVDWVSDSTLFDESQRLYRHASHPLVVFEDEVRATMERAIVGVLYAAGLHRHPPPGPPRRGRESRRLPAQAHRHRGTPDQGLGQRLTPPEMSANGGQSPARNLGSRALRKSTAACQWFSAKAVQPEAG